MMGWAASDETRPRETLCRWEHDNGLAILNMSARAFDCSGRPVGTLKTHDRVSVSPDGRRIAWIFCESADDARPGKKTSVRTMSEGSEESAVSIGYIEGLKRVNRVSISSTGVAAMVVSRGRGDRGLLMVSHGERASDLTRALRDFWPDEIETLRLCGDGTLLVAGSRELFVVIDITKCIGVLRKAGRFPSLSPNGACLAYRDVDDRLASLSIHDTEVRFPLGQSKVRGVGSWSQDNRYLFIGTRSNEFMANRLKVLDVADGEVIDLIKLGEGIYGNRCTWIRRGFLAT